MVAELQTQLVKISRAGVSTKIKGCNPRLGGAYGGVRGEMRADGGGGEKCVDAFEVGCSRDDWAVFSHFLIKRHLPPKRI